MKTSTILLTLLPMALGAPQATNGAQATDGPGLPEAGWIGLGFNTAAASYLASAIRDPGISSAFQAYMTAVGGAQPTITDTRVNSAGGLVDPNQVLTAFAGAITSAPSADRGIISSYLYQGIALQNSATASSGAAASSGTSHAAAPRQTVGVAVMGAVVAGVAGLAAAL